MMLHLILGLAMLGFLVYLVTTKIPMNDGVRQTIIVIVIVCVVVYVANLMGFVDIPIPRLR